MQGPVLVKVWKFQEIFLGPMWKVRNFDLKAGGEFRGQNCWKKWMPSCNLCQTPQFLGTIFQVSWCPFLCRFCLSKAGRWNHGFHSWIAPFNGNCIGVLDWQHYDISMMKTFRSLVMSPSRSRLEARGHLCCSNPMQVYSIRHQHVWKGMT